MSIDIQNVSYAAPEQKQGRILQDVNFSIEPGRITLLVGQTGSGKSTLLHVLAGLKEPSEGRVLVGDSPLWRKGVPDISLTRTFGLLFQYPEHQFFLPTVREEILYSLKPFRFNSSQKERILKETSQVCGMAEELLPRSPFFLSGGEKRKAAIASVLAAQPTWLLLDEPSSGLDSKLAAWFAEQLEAMKEQKGDAGGIVIVTHDLDLFLPVADAVVLLKDGKVLGSWTPAELVKGPGILEAAGVSVPACVKLAALLEGASPNAQAGLPVSLKAADVAEGLAEWLHSGKQPETVLSFSPQVAICAPVLLAGLEDGVDQNPLASLDPRSKWFIYMLFSIAVFVQPDWPVVGIGMLIVLLFAQIAKMPLTKLRRPLFPLGFFMLLSFIISGLQLSISTNPLSLAGTRFLWVAAVNTLERLAPLLPVMAGGVVFAYSTSPMSMKKGLEAPLKKIPGFTKGAETIALATSLMFRFMKLIPAEIERFSLLASVRGKSGRPGKLRLRQLPAFFTPLLLSVMQHAEDMSVAMEARGYGKLEAAKRTNATPLEWKRLDGVACLWGILISAVLLVIGLLWG